MQKKPGLVKLKSIFEVVETVPDPTAFRLPVVQSGARVVFSVDGRPVSAHDGEMLAAALMAAGVMIVFTVICRLLAAPMVGFFSSDTQVVAVGAEYLRIVCWTFAGSGIIYVGSSMFQALGHTMPALVASFCRIALVAVPAFIMSGMPGFQLRWIWYLSIAALIVQLTLNLLLLQREMRVRLAFAPVERT